MLILSPFRIAHLKAFDHFFLWWSEFRLFWFIFFIFQVFILFRKIFFLQELSFVPHEFPYLFNISGGIIINFFYYILINGFTCECNFFFVIAVPRWFWWVWGDCSLKFFDKFFFSLSSIPETIIKVENNVFSRFARFFSKKFGMLLDQFVYLAALAKEFECR